MSIVATEIESVHGEVPQKVIYYRCQDSLGTWHSYGPVITSDAAFDAEGYKTTVATKVAETLAETEATSLLST